MIEIIKAMIPKFYIIVNQTRKYITPEPEEIRASQGAMMWGIKSGIVSLINPIRTSTVYWEFAGDNN